MDEVTKAINHFCALMEDQNSKLNAVLEGINSLPTHNDFYRLEDKVDDLSQRMGFVEVTIKDVSRDLKQHASLPVHVVNRHA